MTTCKSAATSRRLDEALDQGFPASDPAALTEPAGDARDVAGCCCGGKSEPEAPPAPKAKTSSCCGGS
jgi:hypothetical protein